MLLEPVVSFRITERFLSHSRLHLFQEVKHITSWICFSSRTIVTACVLMKANTLSPDLIKEGNLMVKVKVLPRTYKIYFLVV